MKTTMLHCKACGRLPSFPMAEAKLPNTVTCPHCSASIKVREKLTEFATPIEMYSVAVEDPAEVARLKAACPAARISDDPADEMYGVPIAPTRQAKLQVLNATGYTEMS